jgi:hypothetical protein
MNKLFINSLINIILLTVLVNVNLSKAQVFTPTNIQLTVGDGQDAWGDYDNDGILDLLLTGTLSDTNSDGITHSNGRDTFVHKINLKDVFYSSTAWGDYDNDDKLDVALTGGSAYAYSYPNYLCISYIFHNNGNGTFPISQKLATAFYGSVAWGDYDNDGYQDVILTGATLAPNNNPISKIYHNNGNKTFTEQTDMVITSVSGSSVAWGDYDNDGYLDILLTGYNGSNCISKIYHNNAGKSFTEKTGMNLTPVNYGSVSWGDYDNDGYLDILLTGYNGVAPISKIYHNDGNDTFTEQTSISLTGVYNSSVAWGDYDNDGNLDILLTGNSTYSGCNPVSKIYRNNGDGTFTEQTSIALPGITGCVLWGDYDNDGDLDILLRGRINCTSLSCERKIYQNHSVISNTKATAPTNLRTVINEDGVTFLWDEATDTETPQKGLNYNLYVYKDGDDTFKRSPCAFTQKHSLNGRRLLPQMGNIQYNKLLGYNMKNFRTGNYKWSIQAVDGGLQGGDFAEEKAFTYVSLIDADVHVNRHEIINTSSLMEYSLNSTDGNNGDWIVCADSITKTDFKDGGGDVWVRQQNMPVNKRKIASIASQALAPNYIIDYINERTAQDMPDSIEYSANADMSETISGTNIKVPVIPNYMMYIRAKATATKVASAIQILGVPNRPDAPTNPLVNDVLNTYDWTNNSNFPDISMYEYSADSGTTWVTCMIKPINVGPVNLAKGHVQVRIKATDTSFKSEPLLSGFAFTIKNTGITNLQTLSINLHPNPANNVLIIENFSEPTEATIFSIEGKRIKTVYLKNKINEIDISQLPEGIYVLKILNNKINGEERFVKQ